MAGFTATGAMSVARQVLTAALLADGRVLVAAGVSANGKPLLSSEMYNPRSGRWTPTGVLNSPHEHSVLVATPDGSASVVGGATKDGDCLMEVWSAATGEWTATIMPPFFTRVDGRALVLGGFTERCEILCRSKSHRCKSCGVSVLIDESAEDLGALQPAGVEIVYRGGAASRPVTFPRAESILANISLGHSGWPRWVVMRCHVPRAW